MGSEDEQSDRRLVRSLAKDSALAGFADLGGAVIAIGLATPKFFLICLESAPNLRPAQQQLTKDRRFQNDRS